LLALHEDWTMTRSWDGSSGLPTRPPGRRDTAKTKCVTTYIHTFFFSPLPMCWIPTLTDCLRALESPQHRLYIFQHARPPLHPHLWGYRHIGFLLPGADTGVHPQAHTAPSLHLSRVGCEPDAADATLSIRGDWVWELDSGVGARAGDRAWRGPPRFRSERSVSSSPVC
jgi:hypothetical protein